MRALLAGGLLTLAGLAAPGAGARTSSPAAPAPCTEHPALSRAADRLAAGEDLGTALRAEDYLAAAYRFVWVGPGASLDPVLSPLCAAGLSDWGLSRGGGASARWLVAARSARPDPARRAEWLPELWRLTNQARAQARPCGGDWKEAAPPLLWDDHLARAAQGHADAMAQGGFEGHTDPRTGSAPRDRAVAAGFTGLVGENLRYTSITPAEALTWWLASPVHCANLMNPRWTHFGAGLAVGSASSRYGSYWVELFGRP